MDNQDRRADLKRLITTLRRVTTAVQVFPFIYSALYIALLAAYNFVPEDYQATLDNLFYISPACIVTFLILSKVLLLCRWHKAACIIPIIPQVANFIDCHVVMLSEAQVYLFNGTLIGMTVLLVFAAYKVFFR